MSLTSQAPTYLYVWESGTARAVCPIAERERDGHVDVYTPYGFSGFTGIGMWQPALERWKAFAAARGYVTGYLVINPTLVDGDPFDAAEVHESNDLFVLDLRKGEQRLFNELSSNRKRQVRSIQRDPTVLEGDEDACRAFLLAHFNRFYEDRAASDVYQLSRETLEALLDPKCSLVVGAGNGTELHAAFLFVFTPYVADYFAGISVPEGRSHAAALLWTGALALERRGIPALNLGGGVTRDDGIAEFKARFGAARLPLRALKQVYRPDVYEELCRRVGADPGDRSGFFPTYQSARFRGLSASHGSSASPVVVEDRTCS
jgi:hypothetical protein